MSSIEMNMDQFSERFEYFIRETEEMIEDDWEEEDEEDDWEDEEDDWEEEDEEDWEDVEDGIYIKAYKGSEEVVDIPEYVDGIKVARLNSLGNCPHIKTINVPDSVSFDPEAFDDCPGLIDDDGSLIFRGLLLKVNADVEVLKIPEGVTEIGGNLIGTDAGYSVKNESIKEIHIPESVAVIGSSAFARCINLESISIPKSVKKIKNHAFEGCESLKQIQLFEGLEAIGSYAFSRCTSLEKVVLPRSLEKIWEGAFADCTSLKEIGMSTETKMYGDSIFRNCPTDENGLMAINGILFNIDLDKFQTDEGVFINIPEYITSISSWTIDRPGWNLDQVAISDQTDLNGDAFSVASIGNFKIYNSKTQKTIFETDMFSNCDNLVFSERFEDMCMAICEKDYRELERFGTIYRENLK